MAFREIFEREVNDLWARLRRLSDINPRLERLYAREADSRVARLVQSAAFAFASASERLDDDDQALLRPLVARAIPECLRPRPSSTILELPSSKSRSGDMRGTRFDATTEGVTVPFEIMWSVEPRPFELREVRVDRLHARLQVLRLVLAGREGVSLATVLPHVLRLFVQVEPRRVALDVLHALRTAKDEIRLESFNAAGKRVAEKRLPREALRWVGIDTEEPPLVNARSDRFRSSSLLRDLFAFPESFSFFDIALRALDDPKTARIELTLPLGHVVEEASSMDRASVRLFCAPATNQFMTQVRPFHRAEGPVWTLAVAERPHAEILEVRAVYTESRPNAQRLDIPSWEAPAEPHTFDRTATYYLLEQAIARTEARTETRLSFATLERFFAPAPGPDMQAEVVASDGALTAGLGLGDVDGKNITRITPSERARLAENHGWRMNAYARMPAVRFAEARHLDEFVRLHDAPHAEGERIRAPRFSWTEHEHEHRLLQDGLLHWGDALRVDIDTAECSDGEAWLIGAIVSRAIAERNERLRFSRLSITRRSKAFGDYEARDGERLPFPLG